MSQQPGSQSTRDERYPLPIFVFLVGLLASAESIAVRTTSQLQGALPVGIMAGLTVGHASLHWHAVRVADHDRAWLQYALAQGGLGIALTMVTASPSVWGAAFTWLVGEAVGMLNKARLAAATLVLYGLLGGAALFAITDVATAMSWLSAVLPTALFVGVVVVLYKRQVEAREQAQQLVIELTSANQQITSYAERVQELTLANERQRMARELHDTLAQDLAGLVLQLEAVNAHLAKGRHERAQAIVQQAMARAREALRDARAAIDDLRARNQPQRLSERITALAQQFRAECEAECNLDIDIHDWDTTLPALHQEQIERIVGEALANIRHHAHATQVTIQLRAAADTLFVEITDDGLGFDVAQVPQTGHYGLHGLHERARLIGGTLRITSAPGAGTSINLELPLPDAQLSAGPIGAEVHQ